MMLVLQPLNPIVVAAMMLAALAARAEENAPWHASAGRIVAAFSEAESAGARKAVERFMTAVNQADRQTMRDAIFCDFKITAQQQGLIVVLDCITFQRSLERAMQKRWGEKAIAEVVSRTTFSAADQAAVKQARVEKRDTGDLMVILPSPQPPILVRPCSDGKYRVVLRALRLFDSSGTDHSNDRGPRHVPERGSQKQIAYIRGVAQTLRRNAQAVEQGKFQTFEQANAALEKALEHAAVDPPALDEAQDAPEVEASQN